VITNRKVYKTRLLNDYMAPIIHRKRTPKGKSGAEISIDQALTFEEDSNPGLFSWRAITGDGTKKIKPLQTKIIKKACNPIEAEFEYRMIKSYEQNGFPVAIANKIDELTLELEYVPGLTFLEEMMIDPELTPEGAIKKLHEMNLLAESFNKALPDFLKQEDKAYFQRKNDEEIIKSGITNDYLGEFPLTAKIRTRANNIDNFSMPDSTYYVLENLESLMKPFSNQYSRWTIDTYAENFINRKKIDFGSCSFGPLDRAKLIDTPYLLLGNPTLWIQKQNPENEKVIGRMEQMKSDLVQNLAEDKGENPIESFMLYQMSRVFSATLLYLHNIVNLRQSSQKDKESNLTQFNMFLHLIKMFAYQDMMNTGLRAVINNYPSYYGLGNTDYTELCKGYSRQNLEFANATKNAYISVFGDHSDLTLLEKCIKSFSLIYGNGYKEFKENCPIDIN